MPNISQKGLCMPESPIRKLVPYAEAAKKKGLKVFHLNIGQPDIKTPSGALQCLKHFNAELIEYSHSAGNEAYRRKLAQYYQSIDIHVNESQILITTGGSEAILFALNTCFDPGDEVIVPEPFYANYHGFAISAGVRIVPVTAHIKDGFALPPMADIEKLITPKTKGIIICNPNNPTGYLYSKNELTALRELLLRHDLYLLADEVYREFCYDGAEHFSSMKLQGVDDHVIMLDSVSKRYSLCGVRIGALVTRNRQVIQSALKFAQARLSPPSLGQMVGEAALETPATYFKEVHQEYIARRDYLVQALNKIPGVICPKPRGAFYAMVQLPVDNADTFAQWLLTDFECHGHTVMVAPASGFYSKPELGKQQVRIAYVLKLSDLEQAIQCLTNALIQYPGRI